MTVQLESQRLHTAEDLLNPEFPDKLVEIIEGALVTMTPAEHFHNVLAFRMQHLFTDFAETKLDLEVGYSDEGFLLQRNPDILLCPDASLFKRREPTGTLWMEFGPEIVVEVLSPSNSVAEIAYKRQKFFAAGSQQFWIVEPLESRVEFHFADGRTLIATGNEVVEAEGLARGMKLDLEELFRKRGSH